MRRTTLPLRQAANHIQCQVDDKLVKVLAGAEGPARRDMLRPGAHRAVHKLDAKYDQQATVVGRSTDDKTWPCAPMLSTTDRRLSLVCVALGHF